MKIEDFPASLGASWRAVLKFQMGSCVLLYISENVFQDENFDKRNSVVRQLLKELQGAQ